ncbi:MerR family transcriptional regulator [Chloroflexota bacterium]
MQNHPVYSIGVVSELLGVHPETIRTWEKSGVVEPPQRRSGKRFYSERDYRRLQFIHKLIQEGLTLRALHYYLRLYPCWKTSDCPGCLHNSDQIGSTKLCWQEEGTYCRAVSNKDPCTDCNPDARQDPDKATEAKPHAAAHQQGLQESKFDHHIEAKLETTKDTLALSSGHQGSMADD